MTALFSGEVLNQGDLMFSLPTLHNIQPTGRI